MLAKKIEDISDKRKILSKADKQFAHPNQRKLKGLMTDTGIWDEIYKHLIVKLYDKCEICKRFNIRHQQLLLFVCP